jgi:hypothetical protein
MKQQPGIFECTRQSLLCWCLLCIEVGARMFEHLVSIGNQLKLFLKNTLVVLLDFQP